MGILPRLIRPHQRNPQCPSGQRLSVGRTADTREQRLPAFFVLDEVASLLKILAPEGSEKKLLLPKLERLEGERDDGHQHNQCAKHRPHLPHDSALSEPRGSHQW